MNLDIVYLVFDEKVDPLSLYIPPGEQICIGANMGSRLQANSDIVRKRIQSRKCCHKPRRF
jgi:hypothetical protein